MATKKPAEIVDSIANRVFHDQIHRAGHSAKRIAVDAKATRDYEGIAKDMNDNLRRNNPDASELFTGDDVRVLDRFFDANSRTPIYTKAQSRVRAKKAALATTPPSGADAPDGFQPT